MPIHSPDKPPRPSQVAWHPVPKDEQLQLLKLPAVGTPLTAAEAQRLATLYALRGAGRVAPNPLVGAILVDRDHRFLAAGAHEQVGSRHAEINALEAYQAVAAAGAGSLDGGTLYVTLEPCAHANRTPACAPRVAKSGVARVVYGILDPNPAVDGRGAALLAAAGVQAAQDPEWRHDCERLAEVFLWNMRQKLPFVALKAAASLDGYIARRGDKRAWLTGERARAYGHFLRTYYDAIVVGQNTLLADDPLFDTRLALTAGRTPLRVVLDPDGAALLSRPACDWRMLQQDASQVLWIVGPRIAGPSATLLAKVKDRGAQTLTLPLDSHGLFAPKALLEALGERGVTSLLLEGGAGLYSSFLRDGLVQKLHLFQAPRLLGGADALSWTAGVGPLTTAADSAIEISPLGEDWVIEASLGR